MASKKATSSKATTFKTKERKNIPLNVAVKVLTEAGYRCAVPTCRRTLAMDMHHMWQVSAGGGDQPGNLIGLCSYCHDLHHRGTIPAEAIYVYKSLLVSLTQAFDLEGIDRLLFLRTIKKKNPLVLTGDGVLQFSRLIAADLAEFKLVANNNGQLVTYSVSISEKGRQIVDTWRSGNRSLLAQVLSSESGYLVNA